MENFIEEDSGWNGQNSKTVIKVIGVGGAGGNAVNTMITRMTNTEVEFIAANTDQQALSQSLAPVKIPLGSTGLGAGMRPEVGLQAANEAREAIADQLRGANMVFITAGMGGGTGTGASPVIAEVAQELGILTVAVVTKPFFFEGSRRMRIAEQGIQQLKNRVHSLIVILNDKLEELLGEDATMEECFEKADEVLYNACSGIAELIQTVGRVNVDFQDVCTVMGERGTAMMGAGEAEGEDRAINAASLAIACPLLEGVQLKGARGLLVNVTGSHSMKMGEYRTAMETVKNFADPEAVVICGQVYDDSMGEKIRVTVIATGLDQEGTDNTYVKPLKGPADMHPADNDSRLWTRNGSQGPWGTNNAQVAPDVDLFGQPLEAEKPKKAKVEHKAPEPKPEVHQAAPAAPTAAAAAPVPAPEPVKAPEPVHNEPENLFGQAVSRPISRPDESIPGQQPQHNDSTIFGRSNIRPASDVFATLNPQRGKSSGLWTSSPQPNNAAEEAKETPKKPEAAPDQPRFEYGIPTFLRKKE